MRWDNLVVWLIVAATAAWFVHWCRRVWNRRSESMCACDQASCPAAKKIESIVGLTSSAKKQPADSDQPDTGKTVQASSK